MVNGLSGNWPVAVIVPVVVVPVVVVPVGIDPIVDVPVVDVPVVLVPVMVDPIVLVPVVLVRVPVLVVVIEIVIARVPDPIPTSMPLMKFGVAEFAIEDVVNCRDPAPAVVVPVVENVDPDAPRLVTETLIAAGVPNAAARFSRRAVLSKLLRRTLACP
jgi:hypothetical protein